MSQAEIDSFGFTYALENQDYPNDLVSWAVYVPSENHFLLSPTQAEFDLFSGTTIDTYQTTQVTIVVKATPNWNTAITVNAQFVVSF